MEFDKTLLAGSTGLMLLKLLEQEDMYGYQMIETLRSRSEHAFDLKAGTLYPLLHALEQKGYITARDEPSAAGLPSDGRGPKAAVREGSRMERLYAGGRKGAEGRRLRWLNRSSGIWRLPERRCAGGACARRWNVSCGRIWKSRPRRIWPRA